ncbi:hypothetical protein CKO23_13895 [Thiocystis violacea]|nr:hypothetical protein [Thiocystis violacea]
MLIKNRALVIGWTGRVDERERSPPNPAPLLVDCAALVHPTEEDWYRVATGAYAPAAPTDPDVRDYRIRLLG